ncbi:hypothetical protein QBC35DRAFT_429629 [Podospora australis]|uniref:Uncharacterized protein n=1 Tax=Podospora australis TaxID=1536484 RepID=A0AAN6WX25_9PEZI|nr:hypothetical protein QBC35DRAFT_429629 [Podospora australis]
MPRPTDLNTPFLDKSNKHNHNNDNDDTYSSEIETTSPPSPLQLTPKHHTLSTLFHPIIYLFAIWGLISLSFGILQTSSSASPSTKNLDVYHPTTLPAGLTSCICGSSPLEALSLGCEFDTLSSAWLPPYCRDAELTAEFERAGPWSYWRDEAGTITLTVQEVAMLGGTENPKFYATRRYHIAHCLFYWQKYWRMRDTGVVMEEMYDSLEHAKHCARLVLNPVPVPEGLIEVPVVMNGSGLLVGKEGGGHGHGH